MAWKWEMGRWLDDRFQRAYRLVPEVLTAVLGPKGGGWESQKVEGRTHVRAMGSGAPV